MIYIECAGVRVPKDWTVDQLREALAKRNIRFQHEDEIIAVFGDALHTIGALGEEVTRRRNELSKLDSAIVAKRAGLACVKCGFVPTTAAVKEIMGGKS